LTNKLATRLGRKPYGKPLERATLDVGTTLSWGLWLYSFRACLAIPGGKVGNHMLGEESARYKDYDLLELFDSYYIDEKRGRKSKKTWKRD